MLHNQTTQHMPPYTKPEIELALTDAFTQFADHIVHVPEANFTKSINGKWTPGQQLEHLIKSVKPVNLALNLPHWLLRMMFGKRAGGSKTYDLVVAHYKKVLAEGAVATGAYIPKVVTQAQKDSLLQAYQRQLLMLKGKLEALTEKELDSIQLPHPLLGKLTLRELLFFTTYHTLHHLESVRQMSINP